MVIIFHFLKIRLEEACSRIDLNSLNLLHYQIVEELALIRVLENLIWQADCNIEHAWA